MTTDQLHQKHLQAIINDAEPHEEIPALIVSKQKTAKQCALITLEHTIGVLQKMKFEPTIYSESISIDMANVAIKHFNAHIDRKIHDWLKNQNKMEKNLKLHKQITFDELVKHGLENGANVVNGMPWSWKINGKSVTHENDRCYIIETIDGNLRFEHPDELIAYKSGLRILIKHGF